MHHYQTSCLKKKKKGEKIRTLLALALIIYKAKRSQPAPPQLQDTSPMALMSLDNKACNFALD